MDHLSKIPDSENENEDQRKYGFFKREGKYFVTEYRKEDKVTKVLSNFIMQILFHLVNGSNNSKRIVKIQRNTGEISIIEVFSSEMKPDTFETILKSVRCTFLGSAYQLKIIFAQLMDTEIEAVILNVLGWNIEHQVYVFADAVFKNNEILKVNNIGIIETDEKRFYLPPFGLANLNNDDFETDKMYSYQEGTIGFEEWSNLFYLSFGTNGAIGILFLILSVFRDVVFNQVRFFPFLFLFGDFGTGKTSFVERLLSLFGRDIIGTPLNNATSVALSRLASTRINGLFYFKEYTSETDEKAQDFILTAYDGAGRTTGVKSNDARTKSFPVKSGLIFDGNHLPTQKTAILSRMILLNFEESTFKDEQKNAYNQLKSAAANGLGKVLVEILEHRELFEDRFKEEFTINAKELKESCKNTFPERTLNHIALLMTPAKILWNQLSFPFKFVDVLHSIIENAENQNNLLKQSSAISIFWESFSNSVKKGLIVRFDGYNSKISHFNIKETNDRNGIMQVKLQNIYPVYVRYCREINLQFLDPNSLKMLLTSKSNKEFLPSSQKGRGAAYTDKNFGTCYQFSYTKIDDAIYISEIEINL
jgi:hypothetical protein